MQNMNSSKYSQCSAVGRPSSLCTRILKFRQFLVLGLGALGLLQGKVPSLHGCLHLLNIASLILEMLQDGGT